MMKWILILCAVIVLGNAAAVPGQESEAVRQYQYAKRLMEDGLNDLAVTQFEEYIRLYPDSPNLPEAQFLMASLLRKIGRFPESSRAFRFLLVKYPEYPRCDEALYTIAQNYISSGEVKKSIEIFERFSLFYPKSARAPAAYLQAGILWYNLNDLVRAEEDWLRLIQEYPQSQTVQTARLKLSALYFKKRDFKAAQAQIDRILAVNPKGELLAKVILLKAQVLAQQYRLNEAEQLFAQAGKLKLSPANRVRVKLAYAGYLMETSHPDPAQKELQPLMTDVLQNALRDSLQLAWIRSEYALRHDQAVLTGINQNQHTFQDSALLIPLLELGINSAVRSENHSFAIDFLKKRLSFEKLDRSDKPLIKQYYLQLLHELRAANLIADALQHGKMILTWDWQDWDFTDQVRFDLAQIYRNELAQPRQALFYYEQILAPSHKSKLSDDTAFYMALCYEALADEKQAVSILRNFSNVFPGSPFIERITKKLEYMQNYKPNIAAGEYSRLSVHLSSLLLDGDKEGAVFAMIQQLFSDFKDYRGAIQLIKLATTKKLLSDKRDQLDRMLGQSFYRLARIDRDSTVAAAHLDSARTCLLQYLTATANPAEQMRVALLVHDIDRRNKQLTTMDFLGEYDFLAKLVARFKGTAGIDVLQLRLGKLLQDYGNRAAKDSIRSAIAIYSDILSDSLAQKDTAERKQVKYSFNRVSPREEAMYFRSEAYFMLQDTNKTLADLETYQVNYPTGEYIFSVFEREAKTLAHKGEWQQAEAKFNQMVQKFYYMPEIDAANMELAGIRIRLQQYQEAIRILQPLRGQPEALYLLGFAHQMNGTLLDAGKFYNLYLNRYPAGKHVPDVYLNLAKMAAEHQQKNEAAYYNDLFLRKFPQDPRSFAVLTSLADEKFTAGDYKSAYEQYGTLLKTMPDDVGLQKKHIICLVRIGKISAANKAMKVFKKKYNDPKEEMAEIQYEIANSYLTQKFFKIAEKSLKSVASKYKNTQYAVYARYSLGKLKLITNHTEEGLDILTKIPAKYKGNPALPEVYLTLGDFYYKTKQFGNALSALDKVLKNNPSEPIEITTRKYLIKILKDVAQNESRLIALRHFLKKYPRDRDAFHYQIELGITYFNLNEYDRAISQLRSLLPKANNDDEAEIRYWIAKSYFNWGQFRKAISEYLKLTYLTKPTKLPWHVTAEYESGLAYMKLSEWDRARELFKNIVKKEGAGSDFGRFALLKLQEVDQMQKN